MIDEVLRKLLVEFSKIDFNNYADLTRLEYDYRDVNIILADSSLHVSVIVNKTKKYDNSLLRNKYSSLDEVKYKIIFDNFFILDAAIIFNNISTDISHFKLALAHEEKLYKRYE